jgi:hypothetical protein
MAAFAEFILFSDATIFSNEYYLQINKITKMLLYLLLSSGIS